MLVFILQTFRVCIVLEFRVFFFFLFFFPLFSLSLSLSLLFFSLYLSPSLSTSGYEEIPQGHNRGYGEIEFVRGDSNNIYILEGPKHLLPGHRKRFDRGRDREWRLSANIYARSVLKILLRLLMKSLRDAEGEEVKLMIKKRKERLRIDK